MRTIPFKARHLHDLKKSRFQQELLSSMSGIDLQNFENSNSFTIMDNDVPMLCGGILEIWKGRGIMWAYISELAIGEKFIGLHKASLHFLEAFSMPRIEMYVQCNYKQAHRWAKMLGFILECKCMRNFQVDGSDCALYARVQ